MCAIDYCDDYATVWRVTHPKARTRHVCCECSRYIQPGETYKRVNHLFDGKWWSDATCAHCDAAGEWLGRVCGGYVQCGLEEELREHWDEDRRLRSILLGRLILGMRNGWHEGADPVPDVDRVRAVADSALRRTTAESSLRWTA